MSAKYILRFDDAHPRMDFEKWNRLERICVCHGLKPIIAIIPDNMDPSLNRNPYDEDFWARVLKWQDWGWKMALHGYQHVLRKSAKGLVKINGYSEFVGHNCELQKSMVKKGHDVLLSRGLKPFIWVAPAHGSNMYTIHALKVYTNIRIISDGLSTRPYYRFGMRWIPQQLWKERLMPFGVWTICLHPSDMSLERIASFETFVQVNKKKFISIEDLSFSKYSIYDFCIGLLFLVILYVKRFFRGFKILFKKKTVL